ncbi:ABC transporter substrate-binding protein [Thermogemmatispora sp.]|uniref:ABC transporter substrate-binding protein n=1 Tax=Thermogemmatispora sp. TaxID=1968838 RepID=UPI001DB62342|nr:ABC transporter substrate-binding protein [Thermogemmatispora sp.]MBX5450997.1 ABC transporter substrate-binding protein [Thermogemmatispora sp.]
MLSSPVHSAGGRRFLPSRSSILLGMLLSLALILAACGGSSAPSSGGGNATSNKYGLITPGVLTVGSDTTYPPQEFIDPATNQPKGFDIDLITEIARRLGLQARIVTDGFDTIFDDLAARRFDLVISAVTINPDRQKKFDFIPYFNAGESLLVEKGNPLHITSVDQLCGQNVGVQTGTVEQTDLQTASENCTKAGKPPIHLTVLKDQTEVVQLLANHRVVATYQDSPVTDYYLKQNPGKFEVGGSVVNAAPEGIMFRKGDTALYNAVKNAFDAMRSDGTYKQLIDKWGVTSGAISLVERRTLL